MPETPTAEIRLGVSVGKRTAPTAVMRVRLRRLLREAARAVIDRHDQELRNHHVSALILVWRQAPSHPRKIGLEHVVDSVESVMTTALGTLDADVVKGAR